jgi:RND superfamily putative drug exporter
MPRLARLVHRLRWPIIAAWLVVVVASAVASSGLDNLLSNRFNLPGTDSERARIILQDHFGERNDSTAVLIVQARPAAGVRDPHFLAAVQAAAQRAASALPRSKVGAIQTDHRSLAYVPISTLLEPDTAGTHVEAMRRAIGRVPGGQPYLSGTIAITHDLQPVFSRDLRRGELIAIPIALLVLLFIFGTVVAAAVPVLFALVTVPTTLGLVWVLAHSLDMSIYVRNLVTLIGIGIAVDYSLLIVYRFREELDAGRSVPDAVGRTMETAGRAVVFSGLTVATGLGLLVFLPMPFIRSLGIGALMIPLVSIAAALTFLPALLSVLGPRIDRLRVVPRSVMEKRRDPEAGFWARLAHAIMRHPVAFLLTGASVMIALALPALALALTPGSNAGLPSGPPSVTGIRLLERSIGPGTLAPSDIVIDTGRPGGTASPTVRAATVRLVEALRADPEVSSVLAPVGPAARFLIDPTHRYGRLEAASRDDYGTPPAADLARRIRSRYVPAARFPAGVHVVVGGGPASGVDFIDRSYSVFPWLVAAVLAITYIVLLRAFRSVLLPLKAVLLNLLSVAAAYGLLVVVFSHAVGTHVGLQQSDQIEAWIPIFLFAMLFGLSMDYEVFLLSRMREAWDETGDNDHAVSLGLERTGRIVTAAAIIMVAAFAGLVAGSVVGLQEFGLGLSAAILLDATVVRAILVPSAMKLLGGWNWWLPPGIARLVRVRPSSRVPDPVA